MIENQAPYSEQVMNYIGPRVREIRIEKKLSQKDLTAKCNILGWDISRGTLAKIESKNRRVSDIEVFNLAKALSVDIETLFNSCDSSANIRSDS
jgi:transcriptional regulator with XRE-family HTH domain